MSGPSSNPWNERRATPGTRWERFVGSEEVVVPDEDWDTEHPRLNRAARRAVDRQRRSKGKIPFAEPEG
ncbi:hypothetical protein [Streptomyces sp. NBC_01304]|uniref:hypothetical protein n=1 Tax=Streptomyces sp. NBC_01304 TaxID=2903818 RepID=UPI002E1668F6|nr:hypothetical protein OG430_48035 [Streptomyces sp. NBC_01304]